MDSSTSVDNCMQLPPDLPPDLQASSFRRQVASLENHTQTQDSAKLQQRKVAPKWKEIQGMNDWAGMLDPMDESLRAEIIRYGKLTQVCYDSFDSDLHSRYRGSCKYNKNKLFEKLGMANCGYEVTKYLYATSAIPFPGVLYEPISDHKWSAESNWIGYVAVCTSQSEIERLGRRDILVAWRGTKTSAEWAEDFRDFLIATGFQRKRSAEKGISHSVKVERGFLSLYTSKVDGSTFNNCSSRDQFLKEIGSLLERYKDDVLSITITGHSLGGALAVLSAYDLAQSCINRVSRPEHKDGSKLVPITAFTFGCPRVGNWAFKDQCEKLNVKILRVVNVNDLVPKVPGIIGNERLETVGCLLGGLPWTYFHVGVQISLNNEHSPHLKPTWNPHYLHNLETYLHLVDGYIGPKRKFCSHGRDLALVNKYTDFLKDEQLVPPSWWQEKNKGLVKNEKGMWVQQEREEEDMPSNSKTITSPKFIYGVLILRS